MDWKTVLKFEKEAVDKFKKLILEWYDEDYFDEFIRGVKRSNLHAYIAQEIRTIQENIKFINDQTYLSEEEKRELIMECRKGIEELKELMA